jgi:hypothetical protein
MRGSEIETANDFITAENAENAEAFGRTSARRFNEN